MGEDLVSIYDTPSHTDTDPSGWVLGFFSLFFAMIIGDAGYGLVFLGTALWLRSKTRTSSGSMKRFVSLVTVLGFACVAWGLLTNTCFSIQLSVDNPVRSHSLLTYLVERQAQYHLDLQDETYVQWVHRHGDVAPSSVHQFLYEAPSSTISPLYDSMADGTMLELALLIGSIHIIISMCRYVNRNMVNAGWIVSILGGYPFCAHYLHASSILYYLVGLNPETSAAIGLEFLICGLLFAFILSIIKNGIADLFFAVMNAISVFADILSYLRLYALGLSGSIVSGMINSLADAFPFAIAVLLIVLAHVVNVVMSIVGGVIHGLRLNFLEWYHYSFDGGGKPFSPLCLETYK
jgi:V/A-type H+-transporting ATPase subunit I